jgi:hypothetical protein
MRKTIFKLIIQSCLWSKEFSRLLSIFIFNSIKVDNPDLLCFQWKNSSSIENHPTSLITNHRTNNGPISSKSHESALQAEGTIQKTAEVINPNHGG